MIANNKNLARDMIEEVWNKRNPEAFDRFLADDFIDHDPDQGTSADREGIKISARALCDAFPDLHVTIDDLIVEAEKVVLRMSIQGTHSGTFIGLPATNRRITMLAITILHIQDNRVAERWSLYNDLSMLQQLGVSSLEMLGV